jgi:hypothetical protein
MGGEGSARWAQSSAAAFDHGDGTVSTTSDLVTAEATGRSFDLRSPPEAGFGVGLAGARSAFEIDVVRDFGQPAYTVLSVPESESPSTSVYQPPTLRTESRPVTRWRMSFMLGISDAAAWILGIRDEVSDVPERDPVFRRVNIATVSTGWAAQRRGASATVGVFYRFSGLESVSFPSPLGDDYTNEQVEVQDIGLRLAGTWLF